MGCQIKFLSSVGGINTVDGCSQSLHYIFCVLCSLRCLRMAGKVFGPECDDAGSVLGTRNVLHPHCCKCSQTIDACWPFQQLSHFTSYVTLDGTNKQTGTSWLHEHCSLPCCIDTATVTGWLQIHFVETKSRHFWHFAESASTQNF